jgi:hypothetical protein
VSTADLELLAYYAPMIRALPEGSLTRGDLLVPALQRYGEGKLELYYAPFDYVNERARIVIVGITPGWPQMVASYEQARRDLRAGHSLADVSLRAKYAASFQACGTRWWTGLTRLTSPRRSAFVQLRNSSASRTADYAHNVRDPTPDVLRGAALRWVPAAAGPIAVFRRVRARPLVR